MVVGSKVSGNQVLVLHKSSSTTERTDTRFCLVSVMDYAARAGGGLCLSAMAQVSTLVRRSPADTCRPIFDSYQVRGGVVGRSAGPRRKDVDAREKLAEITIHYFAPAKICRIHIATSKPSQRRFRISP